MAVASPPSTCRTSSNRSSRPSRSAKARAWDFQSATALSATTAVRSTSKALPARGAFFASGSRCGHLAKSNTGTVTTSISRHRLWQLVDVEDPREQNSALDQWQDLQARHHTTLGPAATTLPCGFFQRLNYKIDIRHIRSRRRKRGLGGVHENPLAVDDEPARMVLDPTAPPRALTRHAVERRSIAGRVGQGGGENQALLLGKRTVALGKKQILFFEQLGAIQVERQNDKCCGAELLDLIFLEAQLRLLVHSAASAFEGGKVDRDRFLAQHARELERFAVAGRGAEVRRWLANLGGADGFASDAGRIGLAGERGIVPLALQVAGGDAGRPGDAGVLVLLGEFDGLALHLQESERFDGPDANRVLRIGTGQFGEGCGRGLVAQDAESAGRHGADKDVVVLERRVQRFQIGSVDDLVFERQAVLPALVKVLIIGRKFQLAILLERRHLRLCPANRRQDKKASRRKDHPFHGFVPLAAPKT